MSASVQGEGTKSTTWSGIDEFLSYWLKENPLAAEERQVFEGYYRSYVRRFGAYVRHHFADQTREVIERLNEWPAARVLEVGSGCGTEALWFALQGARVTGCDLATERIAVARARRDWLERAGYRLDVQFEEVSLFDFQPASSFDLVWMEMTFHHIEPREQVYRRLFDLLTPGGRLVICEANGWNPLLQLQFFLQRGFRTKGYVVDSAGRRVEYGNERITTPGALSSNLRRTGFDIRSIRHFRLFPNMDLPLAWLPIERALVRVLPPLATHYTVVAERPS